MPFLDKLEKGLLFRVTRLMTLLLICVLAVAIVVTGFIAYKKLAVNTHVSPDEVLGASAPKAQTLLPMERSNEQSGLSLPFNVQKYFSGPNDLALLQETIKDLSESERKDFINNLSEVVNEAETRKLDVVEAIAKYFRLKNHKLRTRPSELERVMVPLYTGGTIFGLILLIAVLSLVLVLLAIERNTRKGQDEQPLAAAATSGVE